MRANGFSFIAPLLVLMVVAFNLPILYMLGLAFWEKGRGFTLEHYEGLVEAPVYLRVLGNTMRIAVIATLANVIIGYPLAHWMRGLQNRALAIWAAVERACERDDFRPKPSRLCDFCAFKDRCPAWPNENTSATG